LLGAARALIIKYVKLLFIFLNYNSFNNLKVTVNDIEFYTKTNLKVIKDF